MKQPSNKWLHVGIWLLALGIVFGIGYTLYNYQKTEDNALAFGKSQLAVINEAAINTLELEIDACSLSLESIASEIDEENDGPSKANQTLVENFFTNIPYGKALYLLSNKNELIQGWGYEDSASRLTTRTTLPESLMLDKDYETLLQSAVPTNGSSYYYQQRSYLNYYYPIVDQGKHLGVLVVPLDLQELYQAKIVLPTNHGLNGYTMVKNADMRIIMHPNEEQLGLTIVEDRKKLYPDLDYSDLERLEKAQRTQEAGTMDYTSYWWDQENHSKVQKLAAYQWVEIGHARWIVASNLDYGQRNQPVLQKLQFTLGLLVFLLAVIILFTFGFRNYFRKNQYYQETLRLKERQELIEERHALEKSFLQESKLETIGLLTTGIVHDMNNFLTPMLGNIELLLEEHQEEPLLHEDLQEIYRAAEKGRQLSQNVLRFSRSHQSESTTQEIVPVVQDALTVIRPLIPKRITLATDFQADAKATFATDDLQTILFNLMTNSYQAFEKNGQITISTVWANSIQAKNYQEQSSIPGEQRFLVVKIADNGPGIPKEIASQIFTPFFTTKSDNGGTGLGLFIVSSIAKRNDWLIELDSSETGTEFRIVIAVAPAE